jgi:hypothetical protein
VLKGGVGSVLHAADVVRHAGRHDPLPALPQEPQRTIATIGHWYLADRSQYLVRTMRALRAQTGDVAIAIVTNDPDAALAGLGDDGSDIVRFETPSAAAQHLLANPRATTVLHWTPPRRRTHPKEMSWGHKPLMRSIAVEHAGFAYGLTHLVHLEDDMALADGALDYWTRARPVLEPRGLLPGFVRWEGRDGDRRISDQQRAVHLGRIPLVEAALGQGDDTPVLWANLPNPHQGCFVLDARLAASNLTTSRYLSPARSLSGPPSWARDLGVIERSAVGAICDDVPPGFTTRNVVPLDLGGPSPRLHEVCLVEHQPALAYFDPKSLFACIPLDDAFVDDRSVQDQAPRSLS